MGDGQADGFFSSAPSPTGCDPSGVDTLDVLASFLPQQEGRRNGWNPNDATQEPPPGERCPCHRGCDEAEQLLHRVHDKMHGSHTLAMDEAQGILDRCHANIQGHGHLHCDQAEQSVTKCCTKIDNFLSLKLSYVYAILSPHGVTIPTQEELEAAAGGGGRQWAPPGQPVVQAGGPVEVPELSTEFPTLADAMRAAQAGQPAPLPAPAVPAGGQPGAFSGMLPGLPELLQAAQQQSPAWKPDTPPPDDDGPLVNPIYPTDEVR
jgi:hypothetical protein